MKTRQFLLYVVVASCFVYAMLAGIGWLIHPHAFKYRVADPSDRQARREIAAQAKKELLKLMATERQSITSKVAGVNDSGTLWAKDRVTMVMAIENYVLERGQIPSSLFTLSEAGYITKEVAQKYILVSGPSSWEIKKERIGEDGNPRGYIVIAKGN